MTRTEKKFYFKFLIAVLIIEAYYAYNYSTEKEYEKTSQILAGELNITSKAEPFYWFALNTERELLYNPSKVVLGQDSF